MRIFRFKLLVLFCAAIFLFNGGVNISSAAPNLSGRILLQVQDKGQAWYVNPVDGRRYYLGRPDDAFQVMRSLGLGVSNADLSLFFKNPPSRLAGRILLQVQDKGQAYYLDPLDLKLYYLGRPADAFNVMRSKGLGITNADLANIPVASGSQLAAPPPSTASKSTVRTFNFKYQNNNYEISQNLSDTWYDAYRNSTKSYSYPVGRDPEDFREAFYGLFLSIKSGDGTWEAIISQLRAISDLNNWTEDQLAEFAMALVQYLPYDSVKLAGLDRNNDPYYPYETLYLQRGVCSDKTFLGVLLLRRLGYGAAILDFPDLNHTAVGIACPVSHSLNGSGYCYIETTNYFPVGVIPQSIESGQAESVGESLSSLFNVGTLGKIEVYQKTSGKIYNRIADTKQTVQDLISRKNEIAPAQIDIDSRLASLSSQESVLNALKAEMDSYYNNRQFAEYNSLIPEYNTAVNQYNSDLAAYQAQVSEYNSLVSNYNQALRDFYQQ